MKILLVNVNWSNTSPAWSVAQAQVLADITRRWFQEAGYGKAPVLDFTVTPFYQLPYTDLQIVSLPSVVPPILTQAGYVPSSYDKVIYVTPRTYSMGNFKGLCWGREMWINCGGSDYAPHATIHELGHSFGLAHPCKIFSVGQRSGNVTTLLPLSQSIGGSKTDLYDAWTAMGYEGTSSHFCAAEKVRLGWIIPAIYDGTDRIYTLTPIEQQGGALYAVKIPCSMFLGSSQRVYWLENRRRADLGNSGLQLRISGDFQCVPQGWFDERAFYAGEVITDGSVTIDILDGGQVRVRPAASALVTPSAPTITLPAGNAAIIASIQAKAAALTAGNVTQAVKDALIADVNALEVDKKLIGANLVPRAHQGWDQLFDIWEWDDWIKPQIDGAISLGCNCIRIIGVLMCDRRGVLSSATHRARWKQVIEYCAERDVSVYLTPGGSGEFDGGVTDSEIIAAMRELLIAVAGYNNIVGVDLLQEITQVPNAVARCTTIANGVRSATTLPLTFSTFGNLNDATHRALIGAISGSIDFFDFHVYGNQGGGFYDPSNPLMLADLDWWHTNYPNHSIMFGEFGAGIATLPATYASFMRSVLKVVTASGPKVLGGLVWAVTDQSDDPITQCGIYDAQFVERPERASIVREFTRGSLLPLLLTGNAMTIASIQTKAAALAVGGITQAVKNALLADVNALTIDSGGATSTFNYIVNGGFEVPDMGTSHTASLAGATWVFESSATISGMGTSPSNSFTYGGPAFPEGKQVGVVQGGGAISQAINLPAGSYVFSMKAAQRYNWQKGVQTIRVCLNSTEVGRYTPPSTGYSFYQITLTVASDGVHTLKLDGVGWGEDYTGLVDDVRLIKS